MGVQVLVALLLTDVVGSAGPSIPTRCAPISPRTTIT